MFTTLFCLSSTVLACNSLDQDEVREVVDVTLSESFVVDEDVLLVNVLVFGDKPEDNDESARSNKSTYTLGCLWAATGSLTVVHLVRWLGLQLRNPPSAN